MGYREPDQVAQIAACLAGESLSIQFKNLVTLGAGGGFPTLIFPLSLGLGDTFPLPFQHHLAFKLADRSQQVQHQPSCWRSRVDSHRQDSKANPFLSILSIIATTSA